MKKNIVLKSLLLGLCLCLSAGAFAQRQMENLSRGVVAIRTTDGVFVSWRLLGTEPTDLGFNVYRQTGNQKAVKLNDKPLTGPTHFIDRNADLSKANSWYVCAVQKRKESAPSKAYSLPANAPVQQYVSIPLHTPERYAPNDCSVGDLDGDGDYELIVHMAGRGIDNPSNGFSDIPIFQAYELDGTFLWEINLGVNIREGAHYTQFMVADLDGDGKAEFACKTGDGTKDALGNVIGDGTKDWRDRNGKILTGPEYFTVFSGETGEALATADYIPERGPLDGWGGWGGNGGNDSNGNRIDRFLACVAYLDGKLPSVVMCRGYYGRSVLAAWDYRDGKLTSRWVFDSKERDNPFSGQGNHNLSVADVDGDGFDEIIYGSMVVDHDGTGLFSTGFRHGDALHVSDLDPDIPGLEVFGIHENEAEGMNGATGPGAALYSARDGKVLFRLNEGQDAGRGVAEDIWDGNRGAEIWFSGSNGLLNTKGERIGDAPRSVNFLIWWDGQLTRQLLDGNRIERYGEGVIFTAEDCQSNNGSKSTPALSADIWGDWREELILRTRDNKELRIFTTTIPTEYRMYTLMHDPVYRNGVAWENVGYNQPPHLGFWLGAGVDKAPRPNIVLTGAKAGKNKR
jgi:rhamnogalacturonan endolyase